jgi:hypothetical protein
LLRKKERLNLRVVKNAMLSEIFLHSRYDEKTGGEFCSVAASVSSLQNVGYHSSGQIREIAIGGKGLIWDEV